MSPRTDPTRLSPSRAFALFGLLASSPALAQTPPSPQSVPAPQSFPAPQSDSLHGPQGAGTIAPLPPGGAKPASGAESVTVTGHRSLPAPLPHAASQQLTTPTNAFNRSINPLNRPPDCKSDWVDVGGQPASPADIGTVEGAHACN